MPQRQIQVQVQKPQVEQDTMEALLAQRSDSALSLVSPYIILVAKANERDSMYNWVAYSMGAVHNILWGSVTPERKVLLDYGCDLRSWKTLNDMLSTRKRAGYVVIGSIARDQITKRILSHLIVDAYYGGNGLAMDGLTLSAGKLSDIFQTYLDEDMTVNQAAPLVTKDIVKLLKPNVTQNLGTPIPKYIIDLLSDTIERMPAAVSKLPNACPSLKKCDDEYERSCDLYIPDFEIL